MKATTRGLIVGFKRTHIYHRDVDGRKIPSLELVVSRLNTRRHANRLREKTNMAAFCTVPGLTVVSDWVTHPITGCVGHLVLSSLSKKYGFVVGGNQLRSVCQSWASQNANRLREATR